MCGIAGIFGQRNNSEIESVIREMTLSLSHRGPDDSGFWIKEDKKMAFGHRRLSVLDLSKAGHQPMQSKCGRFIITFNGEIYNHLELRKELESEFGRNSWIGSSDTETILECFSRWGVYKSIEKMVGMFAFGLWDKTNEKLYLARDRMGEKPLYFGWIGGSFSFASELKAFKKNPFFDNEIDSDSLCLFLRHTYIPCPRSIYKNIYKLQPGFILNLDIKDTSSPPGQKFFSSDHNLTQFWSLKNIFEDGQKNMIKDENEALILLEETLKKAIRLQSLSDVPLGCFLSGGIDSSLIVSLMQSESSSPVHTYTIGFEESGYDEATYAKKVASHLKTKHTELYMSAQDALNVVPLLPSLYDEPFADSSQIPTYLVSRMAREHVTVALSGDAGDELFGGYNRHLRAPSLYKLMSFFPDFLKPGLSNFITLFPSSFLNTLGNNLPGSYKTSFLGHKLHRFGDRLLSVKKDEDLYHSFVSEWKNPSEVVLKSQEPQSILKNELLKVDLDSFEERMMFMDAMTYLPDDILVKVDRASMGVSLETRAPFLDHRVVELSASIPLKYKIEKGTGKKILRKILYKYVPRKLLERPKQGFGIPLGHWLRDPLRDWSEDLLSENRLKSQGFFDPVKIRSRWDEHLKGKKNWESSLWNVLMFQSWLDSQ